MGGESSHVGRNGNRGIDDLLDVCACGFGGRRFTTRLSWRSGCGLFDQLGGLFEAGRIGLGGVLSLNQLRRSCMASDNALGRQICGHGRNSL